MKVKLNFAKVLVSSLLCLTLVLSGSVQKVSAFQQHTETSPPISMGELNYQDLPEDYDVTMVRESDLTDKSELVKELYQNHKYVLIYKEDGTLSIEKASNALGFSGGSQENNLEWKPIAVGFIKKTDGNPLVHNFYSKAELDIRKHPRQMEQLLSKDLMDANQSQENKSAVTTNSVSTQSTTPGPWDCSNTYFDPPWGNVTLTRHMEPQRVNDNTKTVWTIHQYITTNPGHNVYNYDSSYSSNAYTDSMTFRVSKYDIYEEITSIGSNYSEKNFPNASLTYPGLPTIGWSRQQASITIHNESYLPNFAQWFQMFANSARQQSYQSEFGERMTITSGVMRVDYTGAVNWVNLYEPDHTTSFAPSDFVPDYL